MKDTSKSAKSGILSLPMTLSNSACALGTKSGPNLAQARKKEANDPAESNSEHTFRGARKRHTARLHTSTKRCSSSISHFYLVHAVNSLLLDQVFCKRRRSGSACNLGLDILHELQVPDSDVNGSEGEMVRRWKRPHIAWSISRCSRTNRFQGAKKAGTCLRTGKVCRRIVNSMKLRDGSTTYFNHIPTGHIDSSHW